MKSSKSPPEEDESLKMAKETEEWLETLPKHKRVSYYKQLKLEKEVESLANRAKLAGASLQSALQADAAERRDLEEAEEFEKGLETKRRKDRRRSSDRTSSLDGFRHLGDLRTQYEELRVDVTCAIPKMDSNDRKRVLLTMRRQIAAIEEREVFTRRRLLRQRKALENGEGGEGIEKELETLEASLRRIEANLHKGALLLESAWELGVSEEDLSQLKALNHLEQVKADQRREQRQHSQREVPGFVSDLYRQIHVATGQLGGNGSGGAIYGEVREYPMQRIMETLREESGFGAGSVFLDIGSGLGKPSAHAAAFEPGCRSLGVEMETQRYVLSLRNLVALSDKSTGVLRQRAERPNLWFTRGDVMQWRSLNPATHVFMFDVGMPPSVMFHIANLFNRSTTPTCVVMSRYAPRRHPSSSEIPIPPEPLNTTNSSCKDPVEMGFMVDPTPVAVFKECRLAGSGEVRRLYLYHRNVFPGDAGYEEAVREAERRAAVAMLTGRAPSGMCPSRSDVAARALWASRAEDEKKAWESAVPPSELETLGWDASTRTRPEPTIESAMNLLECDWDIVHMAAESEAVLLDPRLESEQGHRRSRRVFDYQAEEGEEKSQDALSEGSSSSRKPKPQKLAISPSASVASFTNIKKAINFDTAAEDFEAVAPSKSSSKKPAKASNSFESVTPSKSSSKKPAKVSDSLEGVTPSKSSSKPPPKDSITLDAVAPPKPKKSPSSRAKTSKKSPTKPLPVPEMPDTKAKKDDEEEDDPETVPLDSQPSPSSLLAGSPPPPRPTSSVSTSTLVASNSQKQPKGGKIKQTKPPQTYSPTLHPVLRNKTVPSALERALRPDDKTYEVSKFDMMYSRRTRQPVSYFATDSGDESPQKSTRSRKRPRPTASMTAPKKPRTISS